MRTYLFGGFSVLLACVVLVSSALGQETRQPRGNQEKPPESTTPAASVEEAEAPDEAAGSADAAEMAAAMQRWIEAGTPGENHKFLEQFVGNWKITMRVWSGGPDSEPSESTGSSQVRSILDGRFLEEQLQGEVGGMAFRGVGLTGYDNFKRKYVGSWIDSMSTSLNTMQGTRDATGRIVTMYGLMDEPMTGEHDKTVKYVIQAVNENKHIFQIYDLSAGEGHKALEVVYERAE